MITFRGIGIIGLLAAAVGGIKDSLLAGTIRPFRGVGVGMDGRRSRKGLRNKEGLPAGYPGAKLARKALRGQIGVRHV